MKNFGPIISLRRIVVAALLSTGVFASARAAQVEVNIPPMAFVPESQETVDIMFAVNNTGVPDTTAVDIGQITEGVTAFFGDTKNDILKVGSIVDTTCGTLAVSQSCSVLARFIILDNDPFDKNKTVDSGLWDAKIFVSWATATATGSAVGDTIVAVLDPRPRLAIPEPSTWMGLLVGFSALGFSGYSRARSRQL